MKISLYSLIFIVFGYTQSNKTKVYLDLVVLSENLVKETIQFVDYVRDQNQADVIILMRRESAANGGNYIVELRGQEAFTGKNITTSYFSSNIEANKVRDDEILRKISVALIPYVFDTSVLNDLEIRYNPRIISTKSLNDKKKIEDRWDNWVFKIGFDFYLNENNTRKNEQFGFDFEAKRITEDIKLEFSTYIDRSETKNILTDTTYIDIIRNRYVDGGVVFSVYDKFSAGFFASYNSSTYGNLSSSVSLMPAIEYNLFPYSDFSKRYITFVYRLGSKWNEYNEVTVYDKLEEHLLHHRLAVESRFSEVWGNAYLNIAYFSYLHDFALNRFTISSSADFKIIEGLAFRINGSYSKIKDQISLAKGELSDEDILRGIKERQSSFSYNISFGLSYSFGSIYNSVVNPRL